MEILKTWNAYLTVFIPILQMILKINSFKNTNNFEQEHKEISFKISFWNFTKWAFIKNDLIMIKFQYSLFIPDTIDTKLYEPEQKSKRKKYLNVLAEYSMLQTSLLKWLVIKY